MLIKQVQNYWWIPWILFFQFNSISTLIRGAKDAVVYFSIEDAVLSLHVVVGSYVHSYEQHVLLLSCYDYAVISCAHC